MASYVLIPTVVGAAKLAAALLPGGSPVEITEIAVGDSNGTGYEPIATMTAMVNEVWRGDALAYLDPSNTSWVVSESVIPQDVGNWWIREMGIFDVDGDMIAIGRYPDTYKPVYAEGAGMDVVVRGILVVSDASQINLSLQPGAAVLTITSGDARYLKLAGGTMLGPIVLSAYPAAAMEAAPKGYVDDTTILPVQALPYPTVATADNRLTVTPAAATAGGTVSVSAGTLISLCEPVLAGVTGRQRMVTTAAYVSADLLANSTYYLRGKISAGVFSLYLQRGTDSDAIPASLVGTPNGTTGGGFDSTVFDALFAKVVTGAAGSVPTVTALANSATLKAIGIVACGAVVSMGTNEAYAPYSYTFNFARTPSVIIGPRTTSQQGYNFNIGEIGAYDDDYAIYQTVQNRYLVSGTFYRDFMATDRPPLVNLIAIA